MRMAWVILAALLVAPAAAAQPGGELPDAGNVGLPIDPEVPQAPETPLSPGEVPVGNPVDPNNPANPNDPGSPGADPGFGDRVRGAFHDGVVLASLATIGIAGLGIAGFAFVTRYISPKEALKNPQRAMLYGFIKGNPGIHLKRLSEEFHMKTSSILWHIRKLESAELVRSERANGFRVFYPTEGGLAVKQVGRAVTALQNPNARALFEAVQANMGQSAATLAGSLQLHVGTARWHLKKLVEFGLMDELPGADGTLFVATPLGSRALQSLNGTPALVTAAPAVVPA